MSSDASSTQTNESNPKSASNSPTVVLNIGMAGSGKTTLLNALSMHIFKQQTQGAMMDGYIVNLDPAVLETPYDADIDIRDTIDYQQVMQEYHLGPNGSIMTCLNLFCTKFHSVLELIDTWAQEYATDAVFPGGVFPDAMLPDAGRPNQSDKTLHDLYVMVDTPGQIEVFTWSASGQIVTSALSSSMPTVLLYVVDTPRSCVSPLTFMSNMLYAISILYRLKLPMILVLNKIDLAPGASDDSGGNTSSMTSVNTSSMTSVSSVSGAQQIRKWMTDIDSFIQDATDDSESNNCQHYASSLMVSMALVLEEFYSCLKVVECSSTTGYGMNNLLQAIREARAEYLLGLDAKDTKSTTTPSTSLDMNVKGNGDLERALEDMRLEK